MSATPRLREQLGWWFMPASCFCLHVYTSVCLSPSGVVCWKVFQFAAWSSSVCLSAHVWNGFRIYCNPSVVWWNWNRLYMLYFNPGLTSRGCLSFLSFFFFFLPCIVLSFPSLLAPFRSISGRVFECMGQNHVTLASQRPLWREQKWSKTCKTVWQNRSSPRRRRLSTFHSSKCRSKNIRSRVAFRRRK